MPPRWYRGFQKPTPAPGNMAMYRGPKKPAPAQVPGFDYMDIVNLLPAGLPGRVSQMALAEMAFRNGGYLPAPRMPTPTPRPVPLPPTSPPQPKTTPPVPNPLTLGPPAPWHPGMIPWNPDEYAGPVKKYPWGEWWFQSRPFNWRPRYHLEPLPPNTYYDYYQPPPQYQKEHLPNWSPPNIIAPKPHPFMAFGPAWLRPMVSWYFQKLYERYKTIYGNRQT